MQYPVVLHTHDRQSFSIQAPDVPGCVSAGDSVDEAIVLFKEALEFHFEGMAEDGDDLPLASSIWDHRDNTDYKDGIWAFVDIDLTQFDKKTEKVHVTLPSFLVRQIDKEVKRLGIRSRSAYLAEAAREKVAR